MRLSLRLSVAVMGAGIALLGAVNSASALRSLGFEDGTRRVSPIELRMSEGQATFRSIEETLSIVCSWTLEASLNRRIAKRSGATMGQVTAARAGRSEGRPVECRSTGTPLREPPITFLGIGTEQWRLVYEAFLGTLPSITGVRYSIRTISIRFNFTIVECLYSGTLGLLASSVRGVESAFTSEAPIPLVSVLGCPTEIKVFSQLRLAPTLTLSLI
jgi:hypothetical protein